jgi:MoxR-like ATPase
VAVPITSSRQFRKGRVLHSTKSPHIHIVLVNSPAPRRWQGIFVNTGGSTPTALLSTRSGVESALLKREYTHYDSGIPKPLPATDVMRLIADAKMAFGLSASDEWRIKRALTIKGGLGTLPAFSSTPPVSPVSPVAPEELDEMLGGGGEESATAAPASPRKRSTSFKIPSLVSKPYWYESENDRKLMRDFIALRKAGFTVNLMIAGPSGSGKTVGIQRLGEELGIPVHIVNCQAITTPEKWLGQVMADPTRGTYFEPSQHIQWVERTHPDCDGADNCIILYDEITRLRPELNNMTYSLFDTQRGLEVPQMGRRVFMHDKNLIVSTANIGAAFSGTFGQDRAFRERFAMTMERDFPPTEEEVKILTSATGVKESEASVLAKVAAATRQMWRSQEIEQPISTRSLVTWALLVAGGYDPMQAAEYTILPLYSEDGGVESDRAKVRLQIEGKSK